MIIPLPFLITALFGAFCIIWGLVYGKRTGKLIGYVVFLVGLGLITVSGKAWKDFKHIEQGSVYAR